MRQPSDEVMIFGVEQLRVVIVRTHRRDVKHADLRQSVVSLVQHDELVEHVAVCNFHVWSVRNNALPLRSIGNFVAIDEHDFVIDCTALVGDDQKLALVEVSNVIIMIIGIA
jgi:hypothetical protein